MSQCRFPAAESRDTTCLSCGDTRGPREPSAHPWHQLRVPGQDVLPGGLGPAPTVTDRDPVDFGGTK